MYVSHITYDWTSTNHNNLKALEEHYSGKVYFSFQVHCPTESQEQARLSDRPRKRARICYSLCTLSMFSFFKNCIETPILNIVSSADSHWKTQSWSRLFLNCQPQSLIMKVALILRAKRNRWSQLASDAGITRNLVNLKARQAMFQMEKTFGPRLIAGSRLRWRSEVMILQDLDGNRMFVSLTPTS